tara:strand:- start:3945 stop:4502 length:558 start_codon:yes stop_codon:yes gene_type:complete
MITEAFTIPFFKIKIDLDFSKLYTLLGELNTQEHELVVGGVSSYINDQDILATIPSLKTVFEHHANLYAKEIGIGKIRITNSWHNVYSKGHKTLHHHHHGSVISGAYYAKAGDNSSPIIFENPFYKFRGAEESIEVTPYSCNENKFDIEDGMLILFPSWITHYTLPNESDERIVISFNTEHTNEN